MNNKNIANPATFTLDFIHEKVAEFNKTFALVAKVGHNTKYSIYKLNKTTPGYSKEKISTGLDLQITSYPSSPILVKSFNPRLKQLFPHKKNSVGLSSAVFYLMLHHFSKYHKLPEETAIQFYAKKLVFAEFYKTLLGFDFKITSRTGLNSKYGYYAGIYPAFDIDTSQIIEKA